MIALVRAGASSLARMWAAIREPRYIKLLLYSFYWFTFWTGLATFLNPPQTVEGELGPTLTVAWSLMLLLGGLAGVCAVFPGWWWAERLAIWSIIAGLSIYASVVLALHFTTPGSRLTQLGMIVLASGIFLIRLPMIRGYSYEPRR